MHLPDNTKTILTWARYVTVNTLFVLCIYFGLFLGHDGAANIALFIGWITVAASIFLLLMLIAAIGLGQSDQFDEAFSRTEQSPVPFWFDVTFDVLVVLAFVYTGHGVLAAFYILNIFVGKHLRDIPKNVVLKKLKGQNA